MQCVRLRELCSESHRPLSRGIFRVAGCVASRHATLATGASCARARSGLVVEVAASEATTGTISSRFERAAPERRSRRCFTLPPKLFVGRCGEVTISSGGQHQTAQVAEHLLPTSVRQIALAITMATGCRLRHRVPPAGPAPQEPPAALAERPPRTNENVRPRSPYEQGGNETTMSRIVHGVAPLIAHTPEVDAKTRQMDLLARPKNLTFAK